MSYSCEHTTVRAFPYYWEYIKRFGKESIQTFRRDFLVSVLVAIATWIISRGDRGIADGVVLGLEASFIAFALIAIVHLVHVSLILHRERYHPENGGIELISAAYGVWGIALLVSMVAFAGYGTYKVLLSRTDTINISMPTPVAPPIQQVQTPPAREMGPDNKTPNPSAHLLTPQPTVPNPQTQTSTPATSQQQALPETFLDRVVQKNRGLTPADRNRLSDVLYSADKFLKQCQALGYKVDLEFGQLTRDRQSGALAKNVNDHIKSFKDLDAVGWEQYHALQRFQSDNQYFSDQAEYVFGDNPFNGGIGLPLNIIEGMTGQLSDWSEIENREHPKVLELVGSFQSEHEKQLHQFFDWASMCLQRITQMRQSLESNGVVQPLPSNTPAPAVGMFSSIPAGGQPSAPPKRPPLGFPGGAGGTPIHTTQRTPLNLPGAALFAFRRVRV
jgi:hypothetical protein